MSVQGKKRTDKIDRLKIDWDISSEREKRGEEA